MPPRIGAPQSAGAASSGGGATTVVSLDNAVIQAPAAPVGPPGPVDAALLLDVVFGASGLVLVWLSAYGRLDGSSQMTWGLDDGAGVEVAPQQVVVVQHTVGARWVAPFLVAGEPDSEATLRWTHAALDGAANTFWGAETGPALMWWTEAVAG